MSKSVEKNLSNSTHYWKSAVLNVLGFLFLAWGLIAIGYQIYRGAFAFVLWFSYAVLIFTGIGILTRNSYLIASQIAILGIPYIFWSIDFLYLIITGNSLWGLTDYIFKDISALANVISIQHLFNIPLSLFSIWIIKLKRDDFWKFSFGQITFLFVIGRLFTPQEMNINCVFSSCFPLEIPLPYFVEWFLFFFAIIGITSLIISSLKFLRPRQLYPLNI